MDSVPLKLVRILQERMFEQHITAQPLLWVLFQQTLDEIDCCL